MFGTPANKPDAEEPEVPARHPDEYEKVLSHREQMFRGLGFNEYQSVALAEASADWHQADGLLKKGCPPDTVLDLLLP